MIIRTALALSAASIAVLPGFAAAQSAMSYDTGQYEYAQPVPELDNDVVTETVVEAGTEVAEPIGAERVIESRQVTPVFVSKPTIQSIDPSDPVHSSYETLPAEPATAARTIPARAPARYADLQEQQQPTYVYVQQPPQVIYVEQAPASYAQSPGGASRVIYREAPAHAAPSHYGYGYHSAPLPAGAQLVAFDRTIWLENCRARLDTYETDNDRGKIIGALVGAGLGGLAGNRIAGRGSRTPGTLIGAGAGAIAGMAVGDAIDDRRSRSADSYGQCEAYLDDYMANATATAGAAQYTQGGQYMLVPVTVAVPQRAVYRDGTPVN